MPAWTPAEKDRAVTVYVESGSLAEAQRAVQRPDESKPGKGTIQGWARKSGVDVDAISEQSGQKTEAARAAHLSTMAAKKQAFAEALMGDLKKLRAQLFAPCVEQKVVTLAGGHGQSATWDIVEVHRDKPTFADQVKILTSIGIAVDKVQILTGEATDRIDITGDVRTRATELADELAQRRATKAA